ncbi:MAG: double-strand break repair helicase AddA [Micavibrio sp.]|nr:double-strand break repair helicase AddA [Micavibrio sp.]
MTDAAASRQQMGQQASARQTAAANPLKSVWVGASAGTGKTKVLIDRVLRLMLPRAGMASDSATRPDKILCLTFTKTAAAEMSNRIYKKLGSWAVMADAALQDELLRLMGAKPDEETLHAARRLFARVLDTPGGLKIMTIHSFCQSVLKRFPVEAGLPPHFQLMDEQSAVEYLKRSEHDIIAAAKRDPSSAMAQAFSRLVLHLDPEAMSDLMAKITAKRSHLARILKNHGDGEGAARHTIAAVYSYLGLAAGETETDILTAAGCLPEADEKNLRHALSALLGGGKTDNDKAGRLQPWLEQPANRAAHYHNYCRAFFTGAGEPYAKMATKAVEAVYPDISAVMQREAERLLAVNDRLRSVRLANLNAALLTVAADMVGRYERYKRQTDQLDFEDLILKTCDLLAEKDMVNWVLFKLDEGIDHILVDEAQDTSPHQWRVIQSLALEFFSGLGTRGETLRTLFVVGDEKQSIFSFQGADPRKFSDMQDFFGAKVRDVQEGWEILLEHSFRSTRAVLDVVDAVFASVESRRGVVGHIEREVKHVAYREGQAGLVELWPLVQPTTPEPGDAWQMPVDIEPGENAASRLARKIAQTIQGWRVNGDILPSKNRPIRAGDVLILVQSRGAIVELLMRALKKEGVPVAGIDRMTLTEEIAIMDLLALARFALQPRDDLTLATVLKCPLIGMDEDALFTLCHGRDGMLWRNLQTHKPDIARYLSGWIERAGYATPYEFFAGILNMPCFADGISGRRAFYGRLSQDIHDALDEFLNAALHYEQSHTPSLQKFTEWFMQGEAQIKREQEQHKADQVRIMTVHASKGLQAPIVFLPDTAKKLHDHNKGRIRLLWPEEGAEEDKGVPLWSPREEFDAGIYAEKRDAAREGQEQEYRRLLYVALTRAEDRLYICGYKNRKAPPADCWHSLVSNAFPAGGAAGQLEAEAFMIDGAVMRDDSNVAFMTRRHGYAQEAAPEKSEQAKVVEDALREPLPQWALLPPAAEPLPPVPLAPSRPGEDEPAAKSPLADDQDWRFRRGVVVHQILEVLPQLPQAEWEPALHAFLARPALEMPAGERKSLAAEILAVLRHPQFAPIFGAGSRAETPIVGLAGRNKALSGQVDRLLVTADEVLIVDYKTNRPPPKVAADVAPLYLKQMAAYRDVIHNIYPGKKVSCALLWTDGPVLMPLSENLLDPYAP